MAALVRFCQILAACLQKSELAGHSKSRQHAEPPAQSSPLVMDVESEQIAEVPEVFFRAATAQGGSKEGSSSEEKVP